ncbi:MAG: cupin domain-containing protein [Rhizobiales bacterium]|nr:cupin domain-containing protein [Hyphomicrobiales bacterium]MBO6700604.1 cupin domain-containing protein [Hyphomicrobiales bacterium]MBO6738140.1 cupin domain-containing protein [Hyphomicrobiales bacterium]MBO6913553.1 cupin domain-containing protein [Hyphomicrobiales bacterium]MBO6955278.1 cupin domain-containing protein [Hyphomicrobiales bacterium]
MQDTSSLQDTTSEPFRIGPPMRASRQKAGMTLQDVARLAGVSIGYLSLIERDQATPTLTTLDRIAQALGVGLDRFVVRPEPVECVTRAAERQRFHVGSDLLGYERVSAQFPGSELSCYVLTFAPGYHAEAVEHAGEEHVYVLSGALELRLDRKLLHLTAGDSVHYPSTRPHAWANPHQTTAQVLWTGTHDIFATRNAKKADR